MIRLVVYPENWLFIYRNLTNYKYNRNLEIDKLTKLGIKLKLQSINRTMFKHLHIYCNIRAINICVEISNI